MPDMEIRAESGDLKIRTLSATDGSKFLVLAFEPEDGKVMLNEDLSLYLLLKPGIENPEILALRRALELACDKIVCVVSPEHSLYAKMPSVPIAMQ